MLQMNSAQLTLKLLSKMPCNAKKYADMCLFTIIMCVYCSIFKCENTSAEIRPYFWLSVLIKNISSESRPTYLSEVNTYTCT